jgi:hypothetical protein
MFDTLTPLFALSPYLLLLAVIVAQPAAVIPSGEE